MKFRTSIFPILQLLVVIYLYSWTFFTENISMEIGVSWFILLCFLISSYGLYKNKEWGKYSSIFLHWLVISNAFIFLRNIPYYINYNLMDKSIIYNEIIGIVLPLVLSVFLIRKSNYKKAAFFIILSIIISLVMHQTINIFTEGKIYL